MKSEIEISDFVLYGGRDLLSPVAADLESR